MMDRVRHHRRLICLGGALTLTVFAGACGKKDAPPTPAQRAQQVQEIVNNPHVPASIKAHLQAQAPAPGAQNAPGAGQAAGK